MRYPSALVALIRELGRLPGIGPKSAQRLAFYLFNQPEEYPLGVHMLHAETTLPPGEITPAILSFVERHCESGTVSVP